VTAWTVLAVDRVVDGDSLRLTRQRIVGEVDGLTITATDSAPVPVRLVHVDTPERGEVGWARARDDLIAWVLANEWRGPHPARRRPRQLRADPRRPPRPRRGHRVAAPDPRQGLAYLDGDPMTWILHGIIEWPIGGTRPDVELASR
jgi:hypothetical protein